MLKQVVWPSWLVGWEISDPFSTKTGYIRDKVFGANLVPPG